MAGEGTRTPTSPSNTSTGAASGSAKKESGLRRTLTRLLSFRRSPKKGKPSTEVAPPTEEPTAVPERPEAVPEQAPVPEPAPLSEPAPVPVPVPVPVLAPELPRQTSVTVTAARQQQQQRRDTRESGPPPAIGPREHPRQLLFRHGLEIDTSEWPLSNVPHRVRAHKKSKDKGKDKEYQPGHGQTKKKPVLTMPNRCGGQDLVRKKITMRVRRTCHRCHTFFGSDKVCLNCRHNRCNKCPREPHKKNKPPGYYDDRDDSDSEDSEPHVCKVRRTYKKPRRRVRWTCMKCTTQFTATKICEKCGSERDDTGVRHPPKKNRNPNSSIPTDSDIERIGQSMQATNLG